MLTATEIVLMHARKCSGVTVCQRLNRAIRVARAQSFDSFERSTCSVVIHKKTQVLSSRICRFVQRSAKEPIGLRDEKSTVLPRK